VWHYEGLVALAGALRINNALKLLNLANNMIGAEGASKLVEAMKVRR
jgi:hypothetical protein